ncbi:VanZ family protein [Cellulomonas sp. P5_C5]
MSVRSRRVTVAALVVYLALVARITLWPEPAPDETFDLVRAALDLLRSLGLPLTYSGLEFAANIAMFVPFGVLVGLLTPPRRVWLVIGAGAATSVAIELAQLAFLPERVSDPRDVVANTLGTAIGVGLLTLTRLARVRAEPVGAAAS